MKTIDLKKYYSTPRIYGKSNFVVVSDEVAEVLERSIKDEKNDAMRQYRAKAYYSLDYGNEVENYIVFHQETPEEIYERKLTVQELNRALAKLPRKQGQHIIAYYFLGKKCKGNFRGRKDISSCSTKVSTKWIKKAWKISEKKFLKTGSHFGDFCSY